MMKNKLKMYIDDSISRLENDVNAASQIQKNTKTQVFLMNSLELGQLRYLLDCFTAAQKRLHIIYIEKSDQSINIK